MTRLVRQLVPADAAEFTSWTRQRIGPRFVGAELEQPTRPGRAWMPGRAYRHGTPPEARFCRRTLAKSLDWLRWPLGRLHVG